MKQEVLSHIKGGSKDMFSSIRSEGSDIIHTAYDVGGDLANLFLKTILYVFATLFYPIAILLVPVLYVLVPPFRRKCKANYVTKQTTWQQVQDEALAEYRATRDKA